MCFDVLFPSPPIHFNSWKLLHSNSFLPDLFHSVLLVVLEAFHFDHETLEKQLKRIQNNGNV